MKIVYNDGGNVAGLNMLAKNILTKSLRLKELSAAGCTANFVMGRVGNSLLNCGANSM